MSEHWKEFFDNYRRGEAVTEADLFYQVGKTVNQKPIAEEIFKFILHRIETELQLSPQDHLFEYCCGNGLLTGELAPLVRIVTAIDFAEHHLVNARKLKAGENITYLCGDAKVPLGTFLSDGERPNKFLMSVALAYFSPAEFKQILTNITERLSGAPFRFFITDIPNFDLKWNFYNTPERVKRHEENEKLAINTNDGMGRWWRREEIQDVCRDLDLRVQISNQPPVLSDYRMDALISSAS